MKYFLDTEFIEDGRTIDLISIALVTDDGRELYCENAECDFRLASEWVKTNVIRPLIGGTAQYSRVAIREKVRSFCTGRPEFWGYYADYDWVVFCQLFGRMVDLPKGWPMYCRDIKQFCDDLGNPKLPKQGKGEHFALADAYWIKKSYEFLESMK